jgi:putative SOS response-associated peptidase YedK
MKDGKPFAFAGLWDEWRSADGAAIRTCTIITTTPNPLMASIHDRMPVILHPEDFGDWLDEAPRAPDTLQHLIASFPAELMEAYPVSALVNSPSNDRAELLQPA